MVSGTFESVSVAPVTVTSVTPRPPSLPSNPTNPFFSEPLMRLLPPTEQTGELKLPSSSTIHERNTFCWLLVQPFQRAESRLLVHGASHYVFQLRSISAAEYGRVYKGGRVGMCVIIDWSVSSIALFLSKGTVSISEKQQKDFSPYRKLFLL